jgi:hypothetical protein
VNAVSAVKRDLDSIKQKFTDLKSRTRKKANLILTARNATGGGEADFSQLEMSEIEEMLDSMMTFERNIVLALGKEWLLGFDCGFDTSQPSPVTSEPGNLEPEIFVVEHMNVSKYFKGYSIV